ncbi:AraC family transcriptional regulator [Pollutimonas bauzanensis]|uniref:Transcriptional regulator, AraC family n=1 Tax=Pollutimonas bauzanensis TaxID=658167 RepID=A0A1M5QLM6_9BURK|nr:AraC family transcriptional regulator [Pollutimonas bauzanensis]SHH14701.1 transcriptional regulator, AraC family [Pollutimonas bauzanensis]
MRGAQSKGVDVQRLLDLADVPASVLDPFGRGSAQQMASLVRCIWKELDDEFMGFTQTRIKRGVFEMMARLVLHCTCIEEMLRLGVRFYNLITDDIIMGVEHVSNEVIFRVDMTRKDLDPAHYFLEFWLVIWHRFLGWASGSPVPLNWAAFAYESPTDYLEEFKYLFPCRHVFNVKHTCISFPIESLRLPIIRNVYELEELLAFAPLNFMTMPNQDQSYTRKIRAFLVSQYGEEMQFPAFGLVADHLHMTEQTLRRRLRDESSSYRGIKENIRRDSALRKLLRGNASIGDIAMSLGYSETRAFTRAFRQWTGTSPVRYRHQILRASESS